MANEEYPAGAAAGTTENHTKSHAWRHKQDEAKRYHSIFELSPDFFDSCRLLQSPFSSLQESDLSLDNVSELSKSEKEATESSVSSNDAKILQRWSCNTCKAEFDSLQDQRFHFKSDLHRFNIKLSIAGRNTIKEDDFDEETSDSLCKEYDVSSISGSEDEDEREASHSTGRQRVSGGISKNKIFIQLQTGQKVSVWRCLLLGDSEHILFGNENSTVIDKAGHIHLTQSEVIEKLNYILREPRDNSCLRIVLLARGGHFAGCVFNGDSLVTHKTFHRYVVRAKAGKKQSSKDAGGRAIHSAGASLRRYNEQALKKDIQELFALWKPYFTAASCIFIYAPSNNHQLFFDGEKPYFVCQHHAIRSIPLTVRRPTFKEARRIYSLLAQISHEATENFTPKIEEQPLSVSNIGSDNYPTKVELRDNLKVSETAEACSILSEVDGLSLSDDSGKEIDTTGRSTPLHEASKSGNAQKVLELLEQGLDPCIKDERAQTPYMLSSDKEVRNTFRRYMASNLEKWDWHAAKVPSALTKEMEESQAAKQAEKDAKRKARAKELKKLRKAKEKKAQAEAAAQSQSGSTPSSSTHHAHYPSSGSVKLSKEEERQRIQNAEREKRAAAAEKRIAVSTQTTQETRSIAPPSISKLSNTTGSDILCSCCHASLAGKIPFHRYHYKYCSTSCMHVHREILEVEDG